MIKAIDLRKGRTIIYEGELSVVHDARHVAKGNKGSYMQTKLKNFRSGTIFDVRFNVNERIEVPFVESKQYEFLYRDGDDFFVMDLETYDQFPINTDLVGSAAGWLGPNQKVTCQLHEGQIISLEVPVTVALEVTEAPPVVKGATATNQLKDVILETGVKVRVPPFIDTGERICVDTRTGEYIERAK
ncbi:MAG: elongation factor P [Phycisphaerae bacterium]